MVAELNAKMQRQNGPRLQVPMAKKRMATL